MLKYFSAQNTQKVQTTLFLKPTHNTETLNLTRPLLTSSGRFKKIQPDSGWMSKYLRSSL